MLPTRPIRLREVALLFLVAAACSETASPAVEPVPKALALVTSPSAAASNAIPFADQPAIQLKDDAGANVTKTGVVITATIATGGGALVGTTTATTGANGTAQFAGLGITGVVGDRTITFSSPGLTSATSQTITLGAGIETQLVVTSGSSGAAANTEVFAQQPTVQLRDISGNNVPKPGVIVTAALATGGGTLGGTAAATTGPDGLATFTNLTITGLLGTRTLTFSAPSLTSASATVNVNAAGPEAKLTIVIQPSSAATNTVAFDQQPVVQVSDVSGNAVSKVIAVLATITAGDPVLGGTATVNTTASGVATFTDLKITGSLGDRALTFSAVGLASVTSNTIGLNTGGPAVQLGIGTPAVASVNGAVFSTQPTVRMLDVSGNDSPKSGVVVTVTMSGGGVLGGTTTATTATNGRATFTDLKITGTLGTRTLTFSASGYQPLQSSVNLSTAGPETQVAITTQPSTTATSGVEFARQPVVQLRDVSGNDVAKAAVVVTAAVDSGAGTLGTTLTASTNANGAATFTGLKLTGVLGARRLSFTSGTIPKVTSDAIDMNVAGAATQLVLTTQPSASAASGAVFAQQPVLQLRDASGNDVLQGGVSVTASLASGGGAINGTLTRQTNTGGQVSFNDLKIVGLIGARTLQFTATDLTTATSGTIALSAGAASQLLLTTQPSSTATNTVAFAQQPVVQVRDAAGNDVAALDVVVTAVVISGGGVLGGGTTVNTNVNGAAVFSSLKITGLLANNHTVRFDAPTLTSVTSTVIDLNTPGPPHQFGISIQPSTGVSSGIPFPVQPKLQLRDISGNDIAQAGVSVTASIASGAGTLAGTLTLSTAPSGLVTFTDLLITGSAGVRELLFSSTGLNGATSDQITVVVPGPAANLGVLTQPSASVGSEVMFPQQPVIQVRDAANNATPEAGVVVTATLTGVGGSLGGTLTATSNAYGVATFTDLSITSLIMNRQIEFSAPALASVNSSNVHINASGPETELLITTEPGPLQAILFEALSPQPVVRLRDISGNNVLKAGVPVTAESAAGAGSIGGTATVNTDASGIAAFTNVTFQGDTGARRMRFTSGSLVPDTSVTIALRADIHEPDNDTSQATTLGSGTPSVSHSINPSNDEDWYRVSVSQTSGLKFETSGIAGGDTEIDLFNASGVVIHTNNDKSISDKFSIIDRQCSLAVAPGTYYLRVKSFNNTNVSSYQVSYEVTDCPDQFEPDGDMALATTLTNGVASSGHTIDPMTDEDWFKFTVTEASSAALYTTGTTGDTYVYLYSSGGILVGSDDDGGPDTFSFLYQSCNGTSLAPGTYYVKVQSYEQSSTVPPYSLTLDMAPCSTSAFNVQIINFGLSTPKRLAALDRAVTRWRNVITGELADVPVNLPSGSCNSSAGALNQTIDDVLIYVSLMPSGDGVGGVLGSAGPCFVRSSGGLTLIGTMAFDISDLDALETSGQLEAVITHELGHVLGIGSLWNNPPFSLLTGGGGVDPYFTGANAIAGFNSIGGGSYVGNSVPVENTGGVGTADAHWRETVFTNELMTGYLSSGANPLSIVTARSLQDLGYVVNTLAVDPFTYPFMAMRAPGGTPDIVRMIGDVRVGPVTIVDSNGNVVGVRY